MGFCILFSSFNVFSGRRFVCDAVEQWQKKLNNMGSVFFFLKIEITHHCSYCTIPWIIANYKSINSKRLLSLKRKKKLMHFRIYWKPFTVEATISSMSITGWKEHVNLRYRSTCSYEWVCDEGACKKMWMLNLYDVRHV